MNRSWVLTAVLLLSLPACLAGQSPATWHDSSPHKIQFVTVDKDVKLEVLDWAAPDGHWCYCLVEEIPRMCMTISLRS